MPTDLNLKNYETIPLVKQNMVNEYKLPSPYWSGEARKELEQRLAQLAEQAMGCWSFAIAEQGPVVGLHQNLVCSAASTIKVPLLLVALTEVAYGNRQLNEMVPVPIERTDGSGVLRMLHSVSYLQLDEVLELMITVSDNTATNMLIDLLGFTTIKNRMHEMKLTETSLRRHMLDEQAYTAGNDNLTSAADLATLLDQLRIAELLPEPLRNIALAILSRQQINDRMPAYLPEDVQCWHKTGELTGVRHDIGILRFDSRKIAFAGLGCHIPEPAIGLATEVIGTAARTVVNIARQKRP